MVAQKTPILVNFETCNNASLITI